MIAGRFFDRTGSYSGALLVFVAFEILSMLVMRATIPLGEEKARILADRSTSAEAINLRAS